MNTKFFAGVATAAALALSPAAFAQDVDSEEAATTTDAAAAEVTGEADAADASASAAVSFTEAQIASFAKAVSEVQTIQADSSLDATTKQTRMQTAVEASGLDIETFNAIATQSQADAALQEKIQAHLTQQTP